MKKYKSSIILLVSSLVFFTSCKESDEVGVDSPVSLINTTLIEDSEITAYNYLESSHEITNNTTYALIGAYEDDYVGTLRSYHYTQIRMINDEPNFGSNYECDSVVLYLSHTVFDDESHTYGDTNQVMPISVWEIEEDFVTDKEYLSTDELKATKKIGETDLNYKPQPAKDQTLAITLDKETGLEILQKANDATNETFIEAFKGLKIGASDGVFGAVLGFENLSSFSKLVVYYNNDASTNLSQDFFFPSTARRFNQHIPDYSATELSGLVTSGDKVISTNTSNLIAIQSGTGLGALLDFPGIKELIDTTKVLSIVKAELVLSIEDGSTSSFLDEPNPTLIAYDVDNDGLIKTNDDDEPVRVNNAGLSEGTLSTGLFFYNADEKSYTMPITDHFEDYQIGEKESLELCIQGFFNDTRVYRSIVSDQQGSIPIKLNFYYSTLK